MTDLAHVKRTPLYEEHVAAGGRMVEFAGYMLPVRYTSLEDEHRAVRTAAGLFDVSHMGEIFVSGAAAMDFVQRISCNDHAKLAIGRAQYTGLMYPEGTFVDDMLVHRMGDAEFMLVVNAANVAKDFAYLEQLAAGLAEVTVDNRSDEYAQIALQGPLSQEILAPLTPLDLAAIRYYRFTTGQVAGVEAIVARTGYTGEDGFEVYVAPSAAPAVWRAILAAGRPKGLVPAGLGCRDTLRFEAGMCLYGHEIDQTTTPLEAGLDWIVKLSKGDFIGRDVIERQQDEGVERKLVGFAVVDRGIARQGCLVFAGADDAEATGQVTSGTHSPTFGKALGLAYVAASVAELGRDLFVEVRGKRLRATIVPTPFYSRKSA